MQRQGTAGEQGHLRVSRAPFHRRSHVCLDQHELASVVTTFAAARPVRAIAHLCGPAPAVPNSKSPAGSYFDRFASRSSPHSVRMFSLVWVQAIASSNSPLSPPLHYATIDYWMPVDRLAPSLTVSLDMLHQPHSAPGTRTIRVLLIIILHPSAPGMIATVFAANSGDASDRICNVVMRVRNV